MVLIEMRQNVEEITNVIGRTFDFIFGMVKICGKDVMSPSQKCNYILKNAYDRCTWKVADWLCYPVMVLRKALCPVFKIGDVICKIPRKIADNLQQHVLQKFDKVFQKFKSVL